tara:strand:- start:191 stop:475 length:285 start_codon:yes stop_codon:yes gene_type:complete
MFINIIIAFFVIFLGHQTRRLEIVHNETMNKIYSVNQEIKINQMEFALHNDNQYLKKLYSIYQGNIDRKMPVTIIKLSELSSLKNEEVYKVNFE